MLSALALRPHAGLMQLPLRSINFLSLHPFSFVLIERLLHEPKELSFSPLRFSNESHSSNYSPYLITTFTMTPKHNRPPLQPRHNRSNTPVHINDGLAAKQRGEDAVESWRFAKNLTIRDPSQTMMTIGRATNTYMVYDGRYEFRFWGSPENV
jgi:hypothetical protein